MGGSRAQRDSLQHLLHSAQGLRGVGSRSTRFLPTAEVLAPQRVLWNPQAAPRRFSQVCSWAPSYDTSFPVSHRPFHVSAVWPGPPRSEGRQGKREVTQAQANSRLYIWRGGRYCQYTCKVVPNFTIRKVIFRALRKYSLQHSLPWALSHLPYKYLISLGCCLVLLLMKYLVGNIPDYMEIQG